MTDWDRRWKKLRRLLPLRTSKPPLYARCGLAALMNGWVEAVSLGKLTTDWTMCAVSMAEDRLELEKFLNFVAASKPYTTHRRGAPERAYVAIQGLVYMAEGALELGSAGYLTADWGMLWMCYGEDVVDWLAERFRP